MEPSRHFTLLQLCTSIRKRLEEATSNRSYWVRAEIASVRRNKHMYLELVEHREGLKVAVLQAMIWGYVLEQVRTTLGSEFDHVLRQGSEVLLRGSVRFNEVHGLTLHVAEVDLSFSLGEMERRKQATITALRAEGVFDLNRALPEPLVIQRIALVSSPGSAAHADLMQHLAENKYGYRFHVHTFQSAVQGDDAPRQLVAALAAIDPRRFDAVVVIRGGGSKLDLDAFNDLELCRAVARMPIPVLTGIGHDVDVSVMDLVARSPHKTPTAVADHLVDKCAFFESGLHGFLVGMLRVFGDRSNNGRQRMAAHKESLRTRPFRLMDGRRSGLERCATAVGRNALDACNIATKGLNGHGAALAFLPHQRVNVVELARIDEHRKRLFQHAQQGMRALAAHVEGMQRTVELLAPQRMLARGFSITRLHGRAIASVEGLDPGQEVETTFSNGTITSLIQRIEHHG